MRKFGVVVALVMAVSSGAAYGATDDVVALNVETGLDAQVRAIEQALAGEAYSEISAEDRGRVRTSLAQVQQLFNGRSSFQELNDNDRVAAFNAQEAVNTIMTKGKEDSRMVCRRERATGSNMPQSVCLTVAQRRRMREEGKDFINRQHTQNTFKPS